MTEETDPLVRVTWEYQEGGPSRLRTSGLASLLAKLGEDVLVQYCRCYVHADRLESLVSMLHSSLEKQGPKGAASFRLYLTSHLFTIGTLFEAATALTALRKALEGRGLFDEEEWKAGLQTWLAWSHRTPFAGRVRKKAAFHVDPEWIREGLRGLAKGDSPFTLLANDSRKARDAYIPLAHSAMLAGANLAQSDVLDALPADVETELLSLRDKLGLSLYGTLKRADLEPILVKSFRVPSWKEEVEGITGNAPKP